MPTTTTRTIYIYGTVYYLNGSSDVSACRRASVTRTTDRLPSYWSKVRNGEFLDVLPYANNCAKWSYPVGKFSRWRRTTSKVESSMTGDLYLLVAGDSEYGDIRILEFPDDVKLSMGNQLNQRILDGIKAQKVNLGQAFGERLQTVHMLEQTLDRLVKGTRALKAGNLSGFAKALGTMEPTPKQRKKFRRDRTVSAKDTFANWWLEYTYGWKPLLSDIYGGMEAFNSRMDTQPGGVVRATVTRTIDSSFSPGKGYPTTTQYYSQSSSHNHKMTMRKGVYYSLNANDMSVFTRSLTQIGLTNPLELAWELMPYSFVVDWFLPIGNYLGSLDATFGLIFKSGYSNVREIQRGERAVTGKGSKFGDNVYYVEGHATDSYRADYFTRGKVTSFPSPVIPTLKNPLSVSHSLSSLALLNQIFKRW